MKEDDSDLAADLTVFVSTVGAASFPDCITHLSAQDCRFKLDVIENVAPMSAAFQQMLDRCSTPFYVQVDEDMILHPFAIRRLHEWLTAAEPDVAFVIGWLWDVHLGRGIQGVKAFRHAICRRSASMVATMTPGASSNATPRSSRSATDIPKKWPGFTTMPLNFSIAF